MLEALRKGWTRAERSRTVLYKWTVVVPNKVIGSGGSTIKYIQETSGAKVDTGRQSSMITISGTQQQISEGEPW